MNDELLFPEDDFGFVEQAVLPTENHGYWKIAVVDDEEQVHHVTRLVLRDFSFEGRKLEFLHAYTASEAIALFSLHNDIAICLLDVVMETDSAGLDVVSKIRLDLGNSHTRIVLRTGQPGQAPEVDVIKNYDINDYKDKTELTQLKLQTLIYSCLRSYRDIVSLQQTSKGLKQVIEASNIVFNQHVIDDFAHGILRQCSSLSKFDSKSLNGLEDGVAAHGRDGVLRIVDGIGKFAGRNGEELDGLIPEEVLEKLRQQTDIFMTLHSGKTFLASSMIDEKRRNILYLPDIGEVSALGCKLLDIFTNNVLIAFQNLFLQEDNNKAQQEMVYLLAEAIESRSKETGYHLKRVAELSLLLATGLELNSDHAIKIYRSSSLHDLGKIAIPDAILNKPGKLTEVEFSVMRRHAQIGHDMIVKSEWELCKTGARIALDHHECWDGNGYPNSKKREEISIEGRITSVADVFDALASRRCYKASWPIEEVFDYMKNKAGSQFDPTIIGTLLSRKEEVTGIYEKYCE